MTSGKGNGLPKAQTEWIEANVSEYLAKTDLGKFFASGNPNPKDDNDLKEYRKEFFQRFTTKFAAEIDSAIDAGETKADNIKRQFEDLLRNCKSTAKDMWIENQAAHMLPAKLRKSTKASSRVKNLAAFVPKAPYSLSKLPITPDSRRIDDMWREVCGVREITGRSLFETENKSRINEEVKAQRISRDLDHQQHPSLFKSRAKELWTELSDAEKEVWNAKAKEASRSSGEFTLASNHEMLPRTITKLMGTLIGPQENGNHKIGNARFYVLYGFRDEDDRPVSGSVDVGQEILEPGFQNFVQNFGGDFQERVNKPWSEYCLSVIKGKVTTPPRTVFACDSGGCPIFPSDASEDDMKTLRVLLSDFVNIQWEWSNKGVQIPENAQDALIDPNFPLILDPLTAPISAVGRLFEEIKAKQATSGAFRLFHNKKAAMTTQQDGQGTDIIDKPALSVPTQHPDIAHQSPPSGQPQAANIPLPKPLTTPSPTLQPPSENAPTQGPNISHQPPSLGKPQAATVPSPKPPATTPSPTLSPPSENAVEATPAVLPGTQSKEVNTSHDLNTDRPELDTNTNDNSANTPALPTASTEQQSARHTKGNNVNSRKRKAAPGVEPSNVDSDKASKTKRQKGNRRAKDSESAAEPQPLKLRRSTRQPAAPAASKALVIVPAANVTLPSGKTAKDAKGWAYAEEPGSSQPESS